MESLIRYHSTTWWIPYPFIARQEGGLYNELYHGSYVDIKEIDFSMSFPNKDFGKGFYLSDNYEQAFQIAKFKSEALAVVNVYEFD